MFISFKYTLKREILLARRGRGQWLNPLIFFVMVTSLFPLSKIGHPKLYAMLAPSIIWIAFLLATILSLESSFRSDFEEGVFEQWILSPSPLWFLLLTKGLAHWFVHLLPMIIIAPFVAYSLCLPPEILPNLIITLLLGTPVLSMIALMGVCLTLGLRNSGLLLSLILLPLTIPVLVLGVSAIQSSQPFIQWALLGALFALSGSLAPLGSAFALKMSIGS